MDEKKKKKLDKKSTYIFLEESPSSFSSTPQSSFCVYFNNKMKIFQPIFLIPVYPIKNMVASQKIKMFHFPFSLFFEDKWKVKQARNELTHNLVNNVVVIKFNKGKSSFGSGFFVCYHVDTFNCSVLAKVIFEVLFFLVFQSSNKHFLDCGICFWFSNFLRKKSQPSINLFPCIVQYT